MLFWLSVPAFSQNYSYADSVAISIPDSISISPEKIAAYIQKQVCSNEDAVRVAYTWITIHISYSLSVVDSLKNEDLVMYALKTRTGKCKNYSALLTVICTMMKIEAYSVLGYTRMADSVSTKSDHAWNIIKMGDGFFLFDPTWDDEQKSYDTVHHQFIYPYFKIPSEDFIQSHMPYDPVMQLSHYPIIHKAFFEKKYTGDRYCNYIDSLKAYSTLDEKDRLQALIKRAETYGINIPELAGLYDKLKFFIALQLRD
jgi:transglutaminase/protease-like cytokinesis protein 3